MSTLKPVGRESMNWIVRFVLIVAIAALTSFGTTSSRYSMQRAGAGRYGVARHDLVNRLEAGVRDLGHKKLLVTGFFGTGHRRMRHYRQVDYGIRHYVLLYTQCQQL